VIAMTKRIKRRWWVRHPISGKYLGADNGLTWVDLDNPHSVSLSEKQIKAINPEFWDWREEDKAYLLDQCNKQERKNRDGWR